MSTAKHIRDYYYLQRNIYNTFASNKIRILCEENKMGTVINNHKDRISVLEEKIMGLNDKRLEFVYANFFAKNAALYINQIKKYANEASIDDDRKQLNIFSCLSVLESSIFAMEMTLEKYYPKMDEPYHSIS